ncbi:MAG: DUF362 domain-containing protein [Deltaproteobacteria bacterium]
MEFSRRQFMKLLGSGFAAAALQQMFPFLAGAEEPAKGRPARRVSGKHDLTVAVGDDPAAITRSAVEAMGGMGRFVRKGDTVVIKPNIGWDRAPEYAGNTNPFVVASLAQMCFEAGARRVNVFDISCNSPQRCYENSGIKKAAEEKGARVYFCDKWNFVKAHFGHPSEMEDWPVFRDAVECDVFINVPILKHHGLTGLTLSMKNLMGVCGGVRGLMHINIDKKLVDMTEFISPDLTVIDAYRVLLRHGPTGGSLDDVELKKTVVCGTDPVLCDSYAAVMMGRQPLDISYIREAHGRGIGSIDIGKADIVKL